MIFIIIVPPGALATLRAIGVVFICFGIIKNCWLLYAILLTKFYLFIYFWGCIQPTWIAVEKWTLTYLLLVAILRPSLAICRSSTFSLVMEVCQESFSVTNYRPWWWNIPKKAGMLALTELFWKILLSHETLYEFWLPFRQLWTGFDKTMAQFKSKKL